MYSNVDYVYCLLGSIFQESKVLFLWNLVETVKENVVMVWGWL